jgi:hypothetical protein
MRWNEINEVTFSVARSLSVVGDRWTMLILRDAFLGVRRFEDFQHDLGMTRHRLADRLRKLVADGIMQRVEYEARPRRFEYRLTDKGLDLYPVVVSLLKWGDRWMAGAAGAPIELVHRAYSAGADLSALQGRAQRARDERASGARVAQEETPTAVAAGQSVSMIRKFQFEAEVYASLNCVPMQTRRKLDAVGLKIGLAQWQQLARGERLMICHAPAALEDERQALRIFIEETTLARCGTRPKELPEEARRAARPPQSPPPQLVANARTHGVELTPSAWNSLDDDERYALTKLGGDEKVSHNLKAALNEFLALHAPSATAAR